MTKLIDLHKESEKHFSAFLKHSALENSEPFFPLEIRFSSPQRNDDRQVKKEKINYLIQHSKNANGFGYEIDWEDKNSRSWGEESKPTRVVFYSEIDFLKFINKEKEQKKFKEILIQTKSEVPELINWVLTYPVKAIDYYEIWDKLLRVSKYFLLNPKPNLYCRELPIEKINTKFVERNKSILNDLLNFIIPRELINSEYTRIEDFEKRFNLKFDIDLKYWVRIRFLDHNDFINGKISQFNLIPYEFVNANFDCKKIFITENKMNFLTFPPMTSSIVIWGKGFNVSLLKDAEWIKNKDIYYWGDIDTHGFQILNQIRGYYKKTKAMMMDFETLNSFKQEWDKGEITNAINLSELEEEEMKLFNYLKGNNKNPIRLEQEKINQCYINKVVEKLVNQ